MTERHLDEPVKVPSDDDFGRDGFAQYLSRFIVATPRESNIRIGLLAPWGEGKTSVMRLAAYHLRLAGVDVAIVPSWGGTSVAQIQSRILSEVRKELKIPEPVPQKGRNLLGRLLGEGKASASPLREEIAGEVEHGALVLRAAGFIAAEIDAYYEKEMIKIIKGRKERRLVIMLDDIDRADPSIMPNLLMSVREAMALPSVTYVLALSPEVLRDALGSSGFGEVSADRFLEKIVEYPFRLRKPSEAEWEAALRRMLQRMPELPGAEALWAVREHLPRNPRRLKLLLRMIAANRSFLQRFDDSELPWEIVHLTFLLRLEFPDWTQLLQSSTEVLSSLSFSDAYWRAVRKYSDANGEEAVAPEEAIPPTGHPERERFIALCRAIKNVGANWSSTYDLGAILDVSVGAASMTRREATEVVEQLRRSARDGWEVQIRARAVYVAGSLEAAVPRFWFWILHERERCLEALADANTPSEIELRLPALNHLTDVVETLLRDIKIAAIPVVGSDVLSTLVEHCARWAHFVRQPEFAAMRSREIKLIELATVSADPSFVRSIALRLQHSSVGHLGEAKEFGELLQRVHDNASLVLLEQLRQVFYTDGGVASLLRRGQEDARRVLLGDVDGPFFSASNRLWLENLAVEASKSEPVCTNIAMYLRALDLALRGEIPLGDPRKVIAIPGMLELLWRGGTAQRLTYRGAGTLNFVRGSLIKNGFASELQMPLPTWWPAGLASNDSAGPATP